MKRLYVDYDKFKAFAMPILGINQRGTPHHMASRIQRQAQSQGMDPSNPWITYVSLCWAGCSDADAREIVEASEMFNSLYDWPTGRL